MEDTERVTIFDSINDLKKDLSDESIVIDVLEEKSA